LLITSTGFALLTDNSGRVSDFDNENMVVISYEADLSEDLSGNSHLEKIDNSITADSLFPIHTFVFLKSNENQQEVLEFLNDLGCRTDEPFTAIPAIPTSFFNFDAVLKTSNLAGVTKIQAEQELNFCTDIAAKADKAVPSSLYSPDTAHDLGYTGKDITIAVIDGGVDNLHPGFGDAFTAGVDFSEPQSPANPYDGSVDPDDTDGHGTGVAYVALGRGDQEGNRVGVAPDAGLIDLKIRKNGPTRENPMVRAIQWCIDNKDTPWPNGYTGVDVISISAGTGTQDSYLSQLINHAVSEGIPVITAATNSGASHEDNPNTADYWADEAIIVGGTDDQRSIDRSDDVHWPQSTWGPRVNDGDSNPYDELKPDVVAPAVNIEFADHIKGPDGVIIPNAFTTGSGTSYATPQVSGVVALMLEANPLLVPSNSSHPIRKILHHTAEARGEPYDLNLSNKYNTHYGYGIVDAFEAVKMARDYVDVNHPPEITEFYAQPDQVEKGGTSTIKAAAIDADEEALGYDLEATGGTISGAAPSWSWVAPDQSGTYFFKLTVTDLQGATAESELSVIVLEGPANTPPVIKSFTSSATELEPGGMAVLTVSAEDMDGDPLEYQYEASFGSVTGDTSTAQYNAPDDEAAVKITVIVTDGRGGRAVASLNILITAKVPSDPPVVTRATITPGTIKQGDSGTQVIIEATIGKQGAEIDLVYADISKFSEKTYIFLLDNGVAPDTKGGDSIYSIELTELDILEPGKYDITVFASDINGRISAGVTIQLEVQISSDDGGSASQDTTDSVVEEEISGLLSSTAIFVIIIIVIMIIILAFVIKPRQVD
jgi:hypothetical protein